MIFIEFFPHFDQLQLNTNSEYSNYQEPRSAPLKWFKQRKSTEKFYFWIGIPLRISNSSWLHTQLSDRQPLAT